MKFSESRAAGRQPRCPEILIAAVGDVAVFREVQTDILLPKRKRGDESGTISRFGLQKRSGSGKTGAVQIGLPGNRGPLIKEESLLHALREGWIAGAPLDTHYHYPMPPDHPLWSLPNGIMTPHIYGSARGPYYLPRLWSIFMQNLDRFLTSKPLLNELSTRQLEL